MATTRQETEPKRSKNNPTALKSRRAVGDWSTVPDYDKLPDWALLGVAEVGVVTGMSRTALDQRVESGSFPKPSYHGKNRVWSLGQVRAWCLSVAGELS